MSLKPVISIFCTGKGVVIMAEKRHGPVFIDADSLTQDVNLIRRVVTAVRVELTGKEALSAFISPNPERKGDFSVVFAPFPSPPHAVLFVGVPDLIRNPIVETLYTKD